MQPDDYRIDTSAAGRAVIEGVLRLHSPLEYETVFEPIKDGITAAESAYTIDISGVRFMNSSGITALSRLVLLTRTQDKSLVIVGRSATQWQSKTIRSLERLYSKLEVQLA